VVKCPRVSVLEDMVCQHYKPLLSVMNKMLPGSVKYSAPSLMFTGTDENWKSSYSQKLVSLVLAKGF